VEKHRAFEFNLRELAGSMGDFGTLFPLAIGYIAVNGLNPTGLFIMLGLTNRQRDGRIPDGPGGRDDDPLLPLSPLCPSVPPP